MNDSRYQYEGLGAFEGGLTYWSGVWRPTENNTEQTEEQKKDSVEQFIPTHPPVVIPHSWRDA